MILSLRTCCVLKQWNFRSLYLEREALGKSVYDYDGRRLKISCVPQLALKTYLWCFLAIKAVKTRFGWIAHQSTRYAVSLLLTNLPKSNEKKRGYYFLFNSWSTWIELQSLSRWVIKLEICWNLFGLRLLFFPHGDSEFTFVCHMISLLWSISACRIGHVFHSWVAKVGPCGSKWHSTYLVKGKKESCFSALSIMSASMW